MKKLLLGLAAAAVAAPVLPACAQSVGQTYSGIVSQTGVISSAAPFTATQTGTGTYTLTAPQSIFPNGLPIMTVTPFGINGQVTSGLVNAESCGNGLCTFNVSIWSLKKAKPANNAWFFTTVQDVQ
jgi:hypothetical protein